MNIYTEIIAFFGTNVVAYNGYTVHNSWGLDTTLLLLTVATVVSQCSVVRSPVF